MFASICFRRAVNFVVTGQENLNNSKDIGKLVIIQVRGKA